MHYNQEERRKELGSDVNKDLIKPMSRGAGLRYVSMIAPISVKNPDTQNSRRLEAKDDIHNQTTLAAVATAI